MAGSVIQASGMVLFEDVLRTVTASAAICAACSVRTNSAKATLNREATQGGHTTTNRDLRGNFGNFLLIGAYVVNFGKPG